MCDKTVIEDSKLKYVKDNTEHDKLLKEMDEIIKKIDNFMKNKK